MIWVPNALKAQTGQMTIVTNHPDLTIKVKRCVAKGRNVIIDLVAINDGVDDVGGFKIAPAITTAYDDDGNVYKGKNGAIGVKTANQSRYTLQSNAFADETPDTKLIPGVPVKISVLIPNFSKEASNIALLELGVVCRKWDMPFDWNAGQRVVVRNIPVNR